MQPVFQLKITHFYLASFYFQRKLRSQVHRVARLVIASTPPGSLMPMSVPVMSEIMVRDYGMHPDMAHRLASQIRKSGPLHLEWNQVRL